MSLTPASRAFLRRNVPVEPARASDAQQDGWATGPDDRLDRQLDEPIQPQDVAEGWARAFEAARSAGSEKT